MNDPINDSLLQLQNPCIIIIVQTKVYKGSSYRGAVKVPWTDLNRTLSF